MPKVVGVSEHREFSFHWTLFVDTTESAGRLMLNGSSVAMSTSGGAVPVRRSNWFYETCGAPRDTTYVPMMIDSTVVSGSDDPRIHAALATLRFSIVVDSREVVSRMLSDVTVHDSVLAARVASLEKFVTEFLRIDHPAAEAMRMLGAKPLENAIDLRRIAKPFMLTERNSAVFTFNSEQPLTVSRPIEIKICLRGLGKHTVDPEHQGDRFRL